MPGQQRVVFLKAVVRNPRIVVGDYSYYDDPHEPEAFERNVLYHFDFIGDRLIIGRFCAIAAGASFIMNGANHRLAGPSTYPFTIFEQGWRQGFPGELDFPNRGDTVVGNDVWLGYRALVMPGVKIGDGAVVAAASVVTADVRPYAVVGGNPARELRRRFADDEVARLQALSWWHWPIDKVTRNIRAITSGSVAELEAAS